MKITVEMSMEEVALINEAVEHLDLTLSFNEKAIAATTEERLDASRKRNIIRQLKFRKEG